MRSLNLIVAIGMLACATPHARAETYPDTHRHITLIVPFSAGGSNDILGRAVAQKLGEAWKLPVVVENQVGASGAIGAARAARSAPDGYTLLILSSTYTINSAVMARLPYNPRTSFAPVAMLGKGPMMLAVRKDLPAKNAQELLALARAKPGTLNYGSAGVGSVNHMSMELLKSLAGLDIKHVPYRAGNEAVNDLIGGHLDMFVGSLPQMYAMVRGDQATGIAVTGPQRSPLAPEFPTLIEAGVKGYTLEQWWGIVAPAGTPRDIVDKLNAELNRIMASQDIKKFMANEGAEPVSSTPEAFGTHIINELDRWTALVEKAGLKVQ
ncbi:MAG TPA: tripartite tricarboxylate transporter substrate binding protein [Pseudolabrys sp.]|nr:tripartite tricarboxylate transporter substrate binding protein [Pseudolabrys sp.]